MQTTTSPSIAPLSKAERLLIYYLLHIDNSEESLSVTDVVQAMNLEADASWQESIRHVVEKIDSHCEGFVEVADLKNYLSKRLLTAPEQIGLRQDEWQNIFDVAQLTQQNIFAFLLSIFPSEQLSITTPQALEQMLIHWATWCHTALKSNAFPHATYLVNTLARLTYDELTTILAALRYFQEQTNPAQRSQLSEHFIDVDPLSNEAIDDLCEKLNGSNSL